MSMLLYTEERFIALVFVQAQMSDTLNEASPGSAKFMLGSTLAKTIREYHRSS